MSDTPPWVDLCNSSARSTPVPFGSESDYLRMLREAQGETSCRASCRVSPNVSALVSRNSLIHSPKSPPNSPNTDLNLVEDLRGIFINQLAEADSVSLKGRCKLCKGCKKCKVKYPGRVMLGLVLTNMLSLLLGAGIGIWISRRTGHLSKIINLWNLVVWPSSLLLDAKAASHLTQISLKSKILRKIKNSYWKFYQRFFRFLEEERSFQTDLLLSEICSFWIIPFYARALPSLKKMTIILEGRTKLSDDSLPQTLVDRGR